MIITLDIETLPTTDPEVIACFADSIKAPATHKKPETIAQWRAENKEQAIKDAVSKTSFDGLYGSIACICWMIDDGPDVFSVSVKDMDERTMLETFYSYVESQTSVEHFQGHALIDLVVCGHNVAGFDLPFMKHRSIINRVKPTGSILKAMNASKYSPLIADTMLMWSSDPQKRASMDRLCKAFGLDGKGDFDGSMVADTWPVDPDKVISYCEDDVLRTREIYKRITFA